MKYSIVIALIGLTQGVKLNWDNVPIASGEGKHEYGAYHIGWGGYERNVPSLYGGPGSGDDMFMWSMINNYAREKSVNGKPSGKFYFKPIDARFASYEILQTHLGLKGKEAEDYLNKYFDKTFRHFDTGNFGEIEAERMPGFFRFLTGNMQINLH